MVTRAVVFRGSTIKQFSPKMLRNLLALAFAVIAIAISDTSAEEKCSVADPNKILRVSIRSKRNETGKWVTKFTARGGAESMADGMAFDISQNVIICGGVEVVEIEGYLSSVAVAEQSEVVKPDPLYFYEKTGANIVLSNNGRTATRKNAEGAIGGGSVITNRPLKDDELFEVRLDKTISKFGRSLSLGVTLANPTNVAFLDHWNYFKGGVWIYYIHNIFYNGDDIGTGYGIPLSTLKIGGRLGVMRKGNGALHFFVNGTDQGAISANVSGTVYGVMDLYGDPVEATILKP